MHDTVGRTLLNLKLLGDETLGQQTLLVDFNELK